jgi:putative selenate reductase
MLQIPFGQLMDWALNEYKTDGAVFGIKKFFNKTGVSEYEIFGKKLELPFGPAAGPHTQLAQNLISSYVAGSRFFELKTVQVLDGEDLPVSKPCILAKDEGYNVEWSTELYVPQALDEYIKGWFALKLLSREFELGDDEGFIFNMSVGYDLEGIKTTKIDNFIEGLKNADRTDFWHTCKEWAYDNLTKFNNIDESFIDNISPEISDSITLSTLHGCPPDEIERIATYLLTEKGLHTYIKCNPTLLGYDYAREALDKLGFDYISFDDRHFKADLQFGDAVPMLKRLQALANSVSLEFGVKLTNTFPVQITEKELPGEEMYMSGRSLFPLSIEVANRLSKAFDGKLRISFSGGADMRNIADIHGAGIWPITIATTLLKPGGYLRLIQIAEMFDNLDKSANDLITSFDGIKLDKLQALADTSFCDKMYCKPAGLLPERKVNAPVPLIDCFIAPCREGCPFGQDVPAYLKLSSEGKHLEALRVITERNPLPFITGTICSHNCMNKCTRVFYESSVDIRSVKLDAAQNAYEQLMSELNSSQAVKATGDKVAIIGGGPAGLSAAYFLAKAGRPVTLFEKTDSLGGIVTHVIPDFRIHDTAIENDVALVKAMGIDVKLNTKIMDIDKLRDEGFKSIVIATGAWEPGNMELETGSAIDALEFLAHVKSGINSKQKSTNSKSDGSISSKTFGENIAVVGGGNTAMDTARAAKRISGVSQVSLVYRRTKRYMPADARELELALDEGIIFYELLAPISLIDGILTCEQMKLGDPDTSGRRSPVPTGKFVEIPADTVISAIGNKTGCEICDYDADDVFVIGDAANGPATVAEAIANAATCASIITNINFEKYADLNIRSDIEAAQNRKGILYNDKTKPKECERCLECATICENCVDVCPNRANISVKVDGRPQIVHIDFMCNECGNCEAFCPYSSAPYLDKLTFYISDDDFNNSKNAGFIPMPDGSIKVRLEGKTKSHRDGTKLPKEIWQLIAEVLTQMNKWFG